jgi:hypothetical protein
VASGDGSIAEIVSGREARWQRLPDKPVSNVAEGVRVARGASGERFINFMAGWAYPDFSVTPMWQLPPETPKLLLGSAVPDFPGAVGLLAAASGTAHVGIQTSRLFVEDFADHSSYEEAIAKFLSTGCSEVQYPEPIDVPVTEADCVRAREVRQKLKGQVYGAIGPRSMQMWNKVSEADFLRVFGIAREGFDGLRLARMAERIPESRAESALNFMTENGMDLRLGTDPVESLTRDMVLFQMKVYCALLDLKAEFGLAFIGVQDQLDWIEHYPATDLPLGLLNNRLRPESDGETFVAATEADDGAAITMQVLKLLNRGEPSGFNDLRYWDAKKGLYWFVNSGALLRTSQRQPRLPSCRSERQTYMYFREGGGTSSVVVRKPGVDPGPVRLPGQPPHALRGTGVTDVTEAQWRERSTIARTGRTGTSALRSHRMEAQLKSPHDSLRRPSCRPQGAGRGA